MFVTLAKMRQPTPPLTRFLRVIVALGSVYVIGTRLHVAAEAPLWLDETWSAMIATRVDWPSFWKESWLDVNPPFYYLFLTGWISIFGDSNLMLRLPSLLFGVVAAALPVVWRPRGLGPTAAWIWAGLILLWPPGQFVMLDARGYALMLLLSTSSCLIFARLLEHLTLKRSAVWVTLGTIMFLTHYFAAVLIAAQGLVLGYRHRTRLFRVWPAAMIAAPGFAWLVAHLPRLKAYAGKDVVWQHVTNAESTLGYILYIFGAWSWVSFGLMAGILVVAGLDKWKPKFGDANAAELSDQTLMLVAGTAAIGFCIAIVIGVVQASLINRYLVPLVPPAMLGLTLIVRRSARQELAGLLLVFVFLLPGLNATRMENNAEGRALYGYEKGSEFIRSYKPDQLLFLWDHPAAKILDRRSLERMGGYFMKRAGVDIPVRTLIVSDTVDANVVLRAMATGRRTGVIWLYNTADRTAARNHAPSFENDPVWKCRDRSNAPVRSRSLGAIACVNMEKISD